MSASIRAVIQCDTCPARLEGEADKSIIALRALSGWFLVRTPSGHARDLCPECWTERFGPRAA